MLYSLKELFFYSIITFALTKTIVLYAENKSTVHTTYREINLTFYHDFPWRKEWKNKAFPGCMPVVRSTRLNSFNFMQKKMECQEHIVLLRKKTIADGYKIEQKRKGYINLSFPEFGLINVQAHINNIKPFVLYSTQLISMHGNKRLITALFIRHVLDVRQYTFKDINKGTFSKINVTPEHLFYAKNKHAFIPIFQVSTHDRLITDTDDQVKLVCWEKEQSQCSQPYQPGQIKQVYNLELSNQHTYFAGDMHLLVHNICALAKELQSKIGDLVTVDKDNNAHLHIRKNGDYKRALDALHEKWKGGYLPALKVALAVSQEKHIPIPITLIQEFWKNVTAPPVDSPAGSFFHNCFEALFSYLGEYKRVGLGNKLFSLEDVFSSDGSQGAIIRTQCHLAIVRKKSWGEYEFSKFMADGDFIFSESDEHLLSSSGSPYTKEKLLIFSYINF